MVTNQRRSKKFEDHIRVTCTVSSDFTVAQLLIFPYELGGKLFGENFLTHIENF